MSLIMERRIGSAASSSKSRLPDIAGMWAVVSARQLRDRAPGLRPVQLERKSGGISCSHLS